MVISLDGALRTHRLLCHLSSGSRLSTGSASHLSRTVARAPRSIRRLLQGGLPFSLHRALARRLWSLLLSLSEESANLDCQDHDRPFPRFHVAPCSLQLGLSSVLRQRPSCAANLAQPFVELLSFACSGAGIRTPTLSSKGCCPTVRRPRIARRDSNYTPCTYGSQNRRQCRKGYTRPRRIA